MGADLYLYEKIKELSHQNGKSLAQIEKEMELPRGSIKNLKKHSPSINGAVKLAEYFSVSIDTLIGRMPPTEALFADERKLLDLYRSMNEQGKAYLMQTAEIAARTYIKKSADISEA